MVDVVMDQLDRVHERSSGSASSRVTASCKPAAMIAVASSVATGDHNVGQREQIRQLGTDESEL
ncbi:hypothetical protein [Amycolatopsis sp. lyj-108]|uniref:hypothetical protein n=1 Tax=Amycolatopsis sp. lyj-108 TaxID=2789286 RepID=UPI00397B0AFC